MTSPRPSFPIVFLMNSPPESRPTLLFGVTDSISCVLYRGMLRYLGDAGFSTTLVSAPGPILDEVSHSQCAASVAVAMEREIRPLVDLVSLWRSVSNRATAQPGTSDASTPKAGLLGSVAAMLARVPCRVYKLRGLRMETVTGFIRSCYGWPTAWRVPAPIAWCVSVRAYGKSDSIEVSPSWTRRACSETAAVESTRSRFTVTLRKTEQVAQLRQTLGLTGNERVIGFVGRFVKDKGIRELVEAFRELSASRPDLRLLLVGDFENGDPVEPDVRQYIESTPAILRTGFVADTAPYYALMDVFVLPTYREGFPGVPLEAQASEVPVVTTNATGAVDSVQHGVTGLIVSVKDVKALTIAIDTLLRNPAMRADMGHAGRKWMKRDFRPETIWQAHADMYREMLEAVFAAQATMAGQPDGKARLRPRLATAALIALSPLLALVALASPDISGCAGVVPAGASRV